MELVDKVDIQKYAKRNTSPKMPIEAKYVQAFIDALMNSTSLQDLYKILADELQNGDLFVLYNSYSAEACNINKEPYRSIVAYAMLKKDMRLFELISSSMFTGSVKEYHGGDLYNQITLETDETPVKYTDEGAYTDMNPGLIQIGFNNYYCDDPLPDGTGSEYQNIEELKKALEDFDYIITLTKPARVQILLFYIPWCYLSGDKDTIETCGIYRPNPPDEVLFRCPFGDEVSMDIINGLPDKELIEAYNQVSMYNQEHQVYQDIESERTVRTTDDAIIFDYDFRCQATSSSAESESQFKKDMIWGTITISSSTGNKTYSESRTYKDGEEYFEKYVPIMLKLNDGDPEDVCLPLEIEGGTPTTGAMFYIRDKQ